MFIDGKTEITYFVYLCVKTLPHASPWGNPSHSLEHHLGKDFSQTKSGCCETCKSPYKERIENTATLQNCKFSQKTKMGLYNC